MDLLVFLDHLLVACGGHCCYCGGVEGTWYYLRWKVEDGGYMYKWVCRIMRIWDGMGAHMGLWVEVAF